MNTADANSISLPILERWRGIPSAIITDISNGLCGIDPDIRPLCPAGQQPALFGQALTVRCVPDDIGAVMRALEIARAGEVLVIAAQGHRRSAMIGGILSGYLRSRGAAGLVCDGAVRDVSELAAWRDFSVFARSITPRGPMSFVHGEVNIPVEFGGRQISPGDLVLGDDDGLVSLTPQEAISLIDVAESKLELEVQWRERLAAGMPVAQALALSAPRPSGKPER